MKSMMKILCDLFRHIAANKLIKAVVGAVLRLDWLQVMIVIPMNSVANHLSMLMVILSLAMEVSLCHKFQYNLRLYLYDD